MKTALITGSSRGIGRAIAIRLANDGYQVILHGASDSCKLQAVKHTIEENGGVAQVKVCDLTDTECVSSFCESLPPVDALVLVATPQELVGMIVEKAVKMAQLMNVPVLGIVENMSYFQCPDCGGQHQIYGPSRVQETAQKYGIPFLAKIPVDPAITAAVDAGQIEMIHAPFMDDLLNGLLNK